MSYKEAGGRGTISFLNFLIRVKNEIRLHVNIKEGSRCVSLNGVVGNQGSSYCNNILLCCTNKTIYRAFRIVSKVSYCNRLTCTVSE